MPEIDGQLFRSFSDAMPLGVCLVDVQGRIIYWNGAAEAITGYQAPEVLGRAYRGDLLLHGGGGNAIADARSPVKAVLRDGRAVTDELFLRHKDGHLTPVHIFAFPVRDGAGEIRGVGEILVPWQGKQEVTSWVGHSDREFEMATGLPAVEEAREHLQTMLRSRSASTSALLLIEMSEHNSIQQHGGAAMLHQALRVLAKTVAGLLPPRHYIGCWNDWRLVVVVPECDGGTLAALQSQLEDVGSLCAVKWWGDRVVVGMRAAARHLDPSQTLDALIEGLEKALKSGTDRKE